VETIQTYSFVAERIFLYDFRTWLWLFSVYIFLVQKKQTK